MPSPPFVKIATGQENRWRTSPLACSSQGILLADYSNYQASARYIFGNQVKYPAGFGKKTAQSGSCWDPSRYSVCGANDIRNRNLFLPQIFKPFPGMLGDNYLHFNQTF